MSTRSRFAGAAGAIILCGALVAGCSGGGGGAGAPQMPTSAATAAGTGSSGTTSSSQTATVNVSIPITPKSASASTRRNPAFVSPGSAYVSFVAQPGSVGVGDVQCTSTTCSGTLQVPLATTSITARITNANAYLLAIATQAVTIHAGQANTVNFVFNGVVTNFAVTLPAGQQFAITVPTSFTATVAAYDQSGYQISTAGGLADASGNILVSADGTTQTMSLVSNTSDVTVSALTWNSGTYTLSGTVTYDGTNTGSSVTLTPSSSVGDTYAYDDATVAENPKSLQFVATAAQSIPTIDNLPAYEVEAMDYLSNPPQGTVQFAVPPSPGSPVSVYLSVTANFNDAGAPLTLTDDSCSNNPDGGIAGSLLSSFPSPAPGPQATIGPSGSYAFTFAASSLPGGGPCTFSITDTTNNLTSVLYLGFDTTTLYVQGKGRRK